MILADTDIKKAIDSRDIILMHPKDDQGNQYPLGDDHLDNIMDAHGIYLRASRIRSWRVDIDKLDFRPLEQFSDFLIEPGDFVTLETYEHIAIEKTLGGTIHSLARLSLVGLMGISTTVHPGWGWTTTDSAQRNLTPAPLHIAVFNSGEVPFKIRSGLPFCRLLFHRMSTSPQKNAPSPAVVQGRATEEFTRMVQDIEGAKTQAKRKAGQFLAIAMVCMAIVLGVGGYFLYTSAGQNNQGNLAQYIGNPISAFIAALLALAVREYRSH